MANKHLHKIFMIYMLYNDILRNGIISLEDAVMPSVVENDPVVRE